MPWQPSASLATLQARARLITHVRRFFSDKGYLEVETPIMGRYGVSDPYLANITASFRGHDYALQTSPEYHMKRLLAAGSGPIFQVARVFREDELGRWHNPEFTLLEWYQLEVDHLALLGEVDEFLQSMLGCPPLQIRTYQTVFLDYCGIDPFATSLSGLKRCLQQFDLDTVLDPEEGDCDQYLFLLMSHVIEPSLASAAFPTAIVDFPASQASLAQVVNGCAARFEVYFQGIELANGFYELTDAQAQAQRFQMDNQIRAKQGKPQVAIDLQLIEALRHGLPACSGVALGVDRLVALSLQHSTLSACLAFDFSTA